MLVLAGDLTNYGQPEEMEPLLNVVVRSRVPTVAVSGIMIMKAENKAS